MLSAGADRYRLKSAMALSDCLIRISSDASHRGEQGASGAPKSI
jgi:hypothetical protein